MSIKGYGVDNNDPWGGGLVGLFPISLLKIGEVEVQPRYSYMCIYGGDVKGFAQPDNTLPPGWRLSVLLLL